MRKVSKSLPHYILPPILFTPMWSRYSVHFSALDPVNSPTKLSISYSIDANHFVAYRYAIIDMISAHDAILIRLFFIFSWSIKLSLFYLNWNFMFGRHFISKVVTDKFLVHFSYVTRIMNYLLLTGPERRYWPANTGNRSFVTRFVSLAFFKN